MEKKINCILVINNVLKDDLTNLAVYITRGLSKLSEILATFSSVTKKYLEHCNKEPGKNVEFYDEENKISIQLIIQPGYHTLKDIITHASVNESIKENYIIYIGSHGAGYYSDWLLTDGIWSANAMLAILTESNLSEDPYRPINIVMPGNSAYWNKVLSQPKQKDSKQPLARVFSFITECNEETESNSLELDTLAGVICEHVQSRIKVDESLHCSKSAGKLPLIDRNGSIYIFDEGSGQSSLLTLNGFNLLINTGYRHTPQFWNVIQNLERIDTCLFTTWNATNLFGMENLLELKSKLDHHGPRLNYCILPSGPNIAKPFPVLTIKSSLEINLEIEAMQICKQLQSLEVPISQMIRDDKSFKAPHQLYFKLGHGCLDAFPLWPCSTDVSAGDYKKYVDEWHKIGKGQSIHFDEMVKDNSTGCLLLWSGSKINGDDSNNIMRILLGSSCHENQLIKSLEEFAKVNACCNTATGKPLDENKGKSVNKMTTDNDTTKTKPPSEPSKPKKVGDNSKAPLSVESSKVNGKTGVAKEPIKIEKKPLAATTSMKIKEPVKAEKKLLTTDKSSKAKEVVKIEKKSAVMEKSAPLKKDDVKPIKATAAVTSVAQIKTKTEVAKSDNIEKPKPMRQVSAKSTATPEIKKPNKKPAPDVTAKKPVTDTAATKVSNAAKKPATAKSEGTKAPVKLLASAKPTKKPAQSVAVDKQSKSSNVIPLDVTINKNDLESDLEKVDVANQQPSISLNTDDTLNNIDTSELLGRMEDIGTITGQGVDRQLIVTSDMPDLHSTPLSDMVTDSPEHPKTEEDVEPLKTDGLSIDQDLLNANDDLSEDDKVAISIKDDYFEEKSKDVDNLQDYGIYDDDRSGDNPAGLEYDVRHENVGHDIVEDHIGVEEEHDEHRDYDEEIISINENNIEIGHFENPIRGLEDIEIHFDKDAVEDKYSCEKMESEEKDDAQSESSMIEKEDVESNPSFDDIIEKDEESDAPSGASDVEKEEVNDNESDEDHNANDDDEIVRVSHGEFGVHERNVSDEEVCGTESADIEETSQDIHSNGHILESYNHGFESHNEMEDNTEYKNYADQLNSEEFDTIQNKEIVGMMDYEKEDNDYDIREREEEDVEMESRGDFHSHDQEKHTVYDREEVEDDHQSQSREICDSSEESEVENRVQSYENDVLGADVSNTLDHLSRSDEDEDEIRSQECIREKNEDMIYLEDERNVPKENIYSDEDVMGPVDNTADDEGIGEPVHGSEFESLPQHDSNVKGEHTEFDDIFHPQLSSSSDYFGCDVTLKQLAKEVECENRMIGEDIEEHKPDITEFASPDKSEELPFELHGNAVSSHNHPVYYSPDLNSTSPADSDHSVDIVKDHSITEDTVDTLEQGNMKSMTPLDELSEEEGHHNPFEDNITELDLDTTDTIITPDIIKGLKRTNLSETAEVVVEQRVVEDEELFQYQTSRVPDFPPSSEMKRSLEMSDLTDVGDFSSMSHFNEDFKMENVSDRDSSVESASSVVAQKSTDNEQDLKNLMASKSVSETDNHTDDGGHDSFDPLTQWNQPLGLPMPTMPATSKQTSKVVDSGNKASSSTSKAKPTATNLNGSSSNNVKKSSQKPSDSTKSASSPRDSVTTKSSAKPADVAKTTVLKSAKKPDIVDQSKLPAFYLDVVFVPSDHDGNVTHCRVSETFFTRIRAHQYILPGLEHDRLVLDSLLSARRKWSPIIGIQEVILIPIKMTDNLQQWATNHAEELSQLNIKIAPAVQHCSLTLLGTDVSVAAAHRIDF